MISCPLCHTETDRVLTRVLRRGNGIVYHCAECDLGFLVVEPRDAKAYYGGGYRSRVSHRAEGGATNPRELFDTYSRYQGDRLKAVLPHFTPESHVLEIGASAGQFISHLNCARRCAIEPDTACCAFMRQIGITTDTKFLRESQLYDEKFDIVCAFQVIEHTGDPREFLKDIRHVLKPGGVAFVECPNLHDPLRSVWGIKEYESFYFHSDHLFYFSGKALTKTALLAGFKNPKIKYTQDYNLMNHLNWITNRDPQPDCHVGLGPAEMDGKHPIAGWLSYEISVLNARYVAKLVEFEKTSNLMMVLQN